jgi:hypothetical protein
VITVVVVDVVVVEHLFVVSECTSSMSFLITTNNYVTRPSLRICQVLSHTLP